MSKDTNAVLAAWVLKPALTENRPLFPNARGSKLRSYGGALPSQQARHDGHCEFPSLKNKRVSAHVLRHTTAMDMLQEGVDRSTIALWLGHESVEITQIYLDANLAIKRAVLDKTTPPERTPDRYQPDNRLPTFLKGLKCRYPVPAKCLPDQWRLGPVFFAVAGLEHLHRSLISVQDAVLENVSLQCIDQRLQLHTAAGLQHQHRCRHAHPVSQGRDAHWPEIAIGFGNKHSADWFGLAN